MRFSHFVHHAILTINEEAEKAGIELDKITFFRKGDDIYYVSVARAMEDENGEAVRLGITKGQTFRASQFANNADGFLVKTVIAAMMGELLRGATDEEAQAAEAQMEGVVE